MNNSECASGSKDKRLSPFRNSTPAVKLVANHFNTVANLPHAVMYNILIQNSNEMFLQFSLTPKFVEKIGNWSIGHIWKGNICIHEVMK